MALQIRRGTNSERLLITPLPGELIYVEDYSTAPSGTNAVYVGDGSTQGGVPVAVSPPLAGVMAGNITMGGNQLTGTGSISITGNISTVGNISNTGNLTTTGNILGTGNITRTGNLALTGNASITGSLNAGVFIGELTGSVFSDDSSRVLVNAFDNSLYGQELTIGSSLNNNELIIRNNSVTLDTSDPLKRLNLGTDSAPLGLVFNIDKNFTINAGFGLSGAPSLIEFNTFTGTFDIKEEIGENLPLAGFICKGYSNAQFGFSGICALIGEDQVGAPSGSAPATFVVGSSSAQADIQNGDYLTASGALRFTSSGILKVPVVQVGIYTTAPTDSRPTGARGMIIFNDTSGKFQGFDGTSWVNLN